MTGSVKQVAWAEKIRAAFVDKIVRRYSVYCLGPAEEVSEDEARNTRIMADLFADHHPVAAWWIDHRREIEHRDLACSMLADWIDENWSDILPEYIARGGIIFKEG